MPNLLTRLLRLARHWRWGVRALVAWALITAILPAPPRAPLGESQTVHTVQSQVCVHTRLIDEVDEWKIQRSLQLTREMGADTIVEFFPWAYIEGVRDRYDWAQSDRIVRHARNQGIHIIARMGLVPAWAREGESGEYTTLNTLPADSYDEFAEFVADFAARYAGVIDQIIIWNEPNLAFEWGYRQIDPAGYVRLLQAVYTSAHRANPNVRILLAPLAPTIEPSGSANGLNDILYLEAMFEAGASGHFDAVAMHTYGFTEPAEAEPGFEALNFRRAELLHEVMARYGHADTPVFITETGWNDNPRWTKAVRPSQRIAYTLGAYRWADQHWDWLDKLCLWVLRYPIPTFNYPDNFTLITTDFQLKPIYYAVQAYARGFEDAQTVWLPPPEG
jgi:polysaccharide biosynthesis protein PslG